MSALNHGIHIKEFHEKLAPLHLNSRLCSYSVKDYCSELLISKKIERTDSDILQFSRARKPFTDLYLETIEPLGRERLTELNILIFGEA